MTKEEVAQIASEDDFKIAPLRADGLSYGTLTWIWSVAVAGRLFVRAYNGVHSRWYNSAVSQQAGKITGAGLERKVRFQMITDKELLDQIDEAYRRKYSESSYLGSMISARAREATVEVS